jgi:hypothetical protein
MQGADSRGAFVNRHFAQYLSASWQLLGLWGFETRQSTANFKLALSRAMERHVGLGGVSAADWPTRPRSVIFSWVPVGAEPSCFRRSVWQIFFLARQTSRLPLALPPSPPH